jgi:hypothetical protein
MNCTSFREAVHEMDRDGLLDAAAYDAAVAHAQTCTRCARLLYQVRRLDASLKALSRADERRETSYRVRAELLRAFRAQPPSRIFTGRTLRWLSAAAAVLILAGGALLAWRHSRLAAIATRPAQSSAVTRPRPAATVDGSTAGRELVQPESAKTASAPALAAGRQRKVAARRALRRVKPPSMSDELEDLADFIPLPYADDDSPLGAGELVRVRLSQSTLGLLGFPVADVRASEPVTADLVIGEDGVARAIRFVSGPAPVQLVQLRTTTSESRGVKQP